MKTTTKPKLAKSVLTSYLANQFHGDIKKIRKQRAQ